MLAPVKNRRWKAEGSAFAVVASRYNERYVNGMLVPAVRELRRARAEKIKVVRVPGAYEIPVVVASLG
jgi:6,7-dimethyl-8-ribityllumazine synthase